MTPELLIQQWVGKLEGLGFNDFRECDNYSWAHRGPVTVGLYFMAGEPFYCCEVILYEGTASSYSPSFEEALSGLVKQLEEFDINYQKTKSELTQLLAEVKA